MRALDERPVNDDVVALLTVFEPQIGELVAAHQLESRALHRARARVLEARRGRRAVEVDGLRRLGAACLLGLPLHLEVNEAN
jgi:hypothetical protein